MSTAYSCWMLNCWCITWPVGRKRLRHCILRFHMKMNDCKIWFLRFVLFCALLLLHTEWDGRNSATFTCPNVFVAVCDVTTYNKYKVSTCVLTNRTFYQWYDNKFRIVRVLNPVHSYGVASGCNTPNTNPDAPVSNSQNIKDKRSDRRNVNMPRPTSLACCLCWTVAVGNN